MAGGFDRFVYSSAGYKAIMKGPAVQGLLRAKAEAVAAVVRSELAGEVAGWDVVADVQVGPTRASALVSGVPMSVEADRRVLGRAVDAAQ